MEKRFNTNKFKVTKSRSALYADKRTARQNLAAIHKESADASCPSNCCARSEASEPSQVDASTSSWRVSQCVNPPAKAGSREGFSRLKFLTKTSRGREVLK